MGGGRKDTNSQHDTFSSWVLHFPAGLPCKLQSFLEDRKFFIQIFCDRGKHKAVFSISSDAVVDTNLSVYSILHKEFNFLEFLGYL
jgi:hypothetical protein